MNLNITDAKHVILICASIASLNTEILKIAKIFKTWKMFKDFFKKLNLTKSNLMREYIKFNIYTIFKELLFS